MLDQDGQVESPVMGGIGPLGWWTVARSLERIADHAVRMGEAGGRLSESAVPPVYLTSLGQFHDQALHHLSAVLESLQEESAARANELLDTGEALHAMGRTLSERLFSSASGSVIPPSSAIALGQILESIGRTTAYAQDIAQVALDRALPLTIHSNASGPAPRALGPNLRAHSPPKENKTGTRNQGGTQKR
jgi:phosphate uptake regulator